MIQTKQGNLLYALKSRSGTQEDINIQRETAELENLLALKKLYQLEKRPEDTNENTDEMLLLIQRYEKNQFIMKRVRQQFALLMTREYELVKKLRIDLISIST